MGLSVKTVPTEEPVTLGEAKLHLRVDGSDDDDLITALIKAARDQCEAFTRRQFVTATYEYTLDGFSGFIPLPRPPLDDVNSIAYVDSDGDDQTVDSGDYDVVTDTVIGYVQPAYGEVWPNVRGHTNDITIDYDAGYGAASAVPDTLKAAIKLLVGHLYENREAVVVGTTVSKLPLAVESLLWPYRVMEMS